MAIPRPQSIAIPILKAGLDPSIAVGSWIPDVDDRVFPLVNLRILGGRDSGWVNMLTLPVIEITVYVNDMLESAQDIMNDCLSLLEIAKDSQTIVPGAGYIHSMFITFPPGQFDSEFDDTWRVQALIQLGVRSPA